MPDLETALDEVTERLAETMFFSTVLDRAGRLAGEPGYAASIAFAGSGEGRVRVAMPQSTAEALAVNFLGEAEEVEAGGRAAALAGELANILCGSLLGRIDPAGRFTISPPEVSAEAAVWPEPPAEAPEAAGADGPARARRVFTLEEGPLAVEVTWSGE